MRSLCTLTLGIWLIFPALSSAQSSLFDRGFGLGVYSVLEWIGQPIPVNFNNPQFHARAYELRNNQAKRVTQLLFHHAMTQSDPKIREELKSEITFLRLVIERIEASSSTWVTKCYLLNEALNEARLRHLRRLVNSSEDIFVTESGTLDYQLEPEDLSGYFYGLQILAESQVWGGFGLRDPDQLTLLDLWYLTESLSAFRKTLLQRMDASLLTPPIPSLNKIVLALGSEPIQKLNQITSLLENQWRVGNNKALQMEKGSPEDKAMIVQFKVLYRTYSNVAQLIDEQHKQQTEILKSSIQSCANLLSRP